MDRLPTRAGLRQQSRVIRQAPRPNSDFSMTTKIPVTALLQSHREKIYGESPFGGGSSGGAGGCYDSSCGSPNDQPVGPDWDRVQIQPGLKMIVATEQVEVACAA